MKVRSLLGSIELPEAKPLWCVPVACPQCSDHQIKLDEAQRYVDALFDGHRVWLALTPELRARLGTNGVTAVLDAVVQVARLEKAKQQMSAEERTVSAPSLVPEASTSHAGDGHER